MTNELIYVLMRRLLHLAGVFFLFLPFSHPSYSPFLKLMLNITREVHTLQVCPVCAMRVGVDMVAHITLQHGNIFKISLTLFLFLLYIYIYI